MVANHAKRLILSSLVKAFYILIKGYILIWKIYPKGGGNERTFLINITN